MGITTQDEQACYDEMWQVPAYHTFSPGAEYLPLFEQLAPKGASVLDAGCGAGAGSLALKAAGYQVQAFDISSAGLTDDFKAAGIPFTQGSLWSPGASLPSVDWAYCTDVMEHIPQVYVGLVIDRLLRAAQRVFFSIGLTPDHFGVWVGRPLHLTVQGFAEWRNLFRELGRVEEARDLLNTGIYVVTR